MHPIPKLRRMRKYIDKLLAYMHLSHIDLHLMLQYSDEDTHAQVEYQEGYHVKLFLGEHFFKASPEAAREYLCHEMGHILFIHRNLHQAHDLEAYMPKKARECFVARETQFEDDIVDHYSRVVAKGAPLPPADLFK